jgi:hypothetical protein
MRKRKGRRGRKGRKERMERKGRKKGRVVEVSEYLPTHVLRHQSVYAVATVRKKTHAQDEDEKKKKEEKNGVRIIS